MFLNGFSDILNKYNLFIVDIWGVIYDEGVDPFPGVIPLLTEIKNAGKKVVFLSNSPRLKNTLEKNFEKLRISNTLYDHIYSSGIETNTLLKEHSLSKFNGKCYLIDDDHELVQDIQDIIITNNIDEADFVIAAKMNIRNNNEHYIPLLEKMIKRNLPLLCPNPDKFVVVIGGGKLFCQGSISKIYEDMGGYVKYIGKPHNEVYERIFSWYPNISKKEILAIGDNMETDVKGGNNQGIDSVFITNGMYANLLYDENKILNKNAVEKLSKECNAEPTYVAEWFAL